MAASWKENWRPASFRGAEFKVDTGSRASGRRGPLFEFPKRDTPYFEDMGRRARAWSISGYVIGPDYTDAADALETAINQEGPGLLVHPTMGEMRVVCTQYHRQERRNEGGMATFDMMFVEAGSPIGQRVAENTSAAVNDKADALSSSAKTANKKLAQGSYPPGGA